MQFLLSKGADPNGEWSLGVMYAISWEGHFHIGDLLLKAGLQPPTEKEWQNPFQLVCVRPRSFNFIGWVFERGLFDMNKAKQDSEVLDYLSDHIRWASRMGNLDFIRTLVEYGFPISNHERFQTADDTFPTVYARAGHHENIAEYLIDLGVPDMDPTDTPLVNHFLERKGIFADEATFNIYPCRMPEHPG
jgi:hypothetical protein